MHKQLNPQGNLYYVLQDKYLSIILFLFFGFCVGARLARGLSLSLCGGVYLAPPNTGFFHRS